MAGDAVKDGGPAFPCSRLERNPFFDALQPSSHSMVVTAEYAGMSLRDYFAAKAIEGKADGQGVSKPWLEEYARSAYALADAMLKAREGHS